MYWKEDRFSLESVALINICIQKSSLFLCEISAINFMVGW